MDKKSTAISSVIWGQFFFLFLPSSIMIIINIGQVIKTTLGNLSRNFPGQFFFPRWLRDKVPASCSRDHDIKSRLSVWAVSCLISTLVVHIARKYVKRWKCMFFLNYIPYIFALFRTDAFGRDFLSSHYPPLSDFTVYRIELKRENSF